MRKTDKKIDNQLRFALTNVCEASMGDIPGFLWLTHLVNYSSFPRSLKVVCVFSNNENLQLFLQSKFKQRLLTRIVDELAGVNVELKNIHRHISYDSEENCQQLHDGNWARRLR